MATLNRMLQLRAGDPISRWARGLAERQGCWRTVVAIAAKNARMCWAVLHTGENFKMPA